MDPLIAGITAGAIEGAITYPTEFIKTQIQLGGFKGPMDVIRHTFREKGILGFYKGMSALVLGNAAKAGVRFIMFDKIKRALPQERKYLPVAGFLSGVCEAILVVTPSETIKTKLIDDTNKTKRFNGFFHGVKTIVKTEGIGGLYKGASAVILRQGANSAVRMSVYTILKQHFQLDKPSFLVSFVCGSIAGVVTVYSTMPFDVIKTKMQQLGSTHTNPFKCLKHVYETEGIFALWKGSVPRLSRLIVSGGFVFGVYEQMMLVLASIK